MKDFTDGLYFESSNEPPEKRPTTTAEYRFTRYLAVYVYILQVANCFERARFIGRLLSRNNAKRVLRK